MGKRILVVEDDITNSMLIKQILTKNEIEVDIANDAISGWEKCSQKNYDLFIVDLNLPFGANGFEFLMRIRSTPEYKNTPVIAITAYIGIFDRDETLNKGFNYYVQKPFDIKYFARLVDKIFEETQ
ncbi:MAG: response regulator [Ignavibacteria bacterium]|nr:response regulator [Ignavibacteria bacterium]